MRAFAAISLTALLSGAAFSQSTEMPRFEVADVHVSPHSADPFPYLKGPFVRGGRYEVRTATMLDLIATAYGLDGDKVLGGPSWLEMDRFEVLAKMPANSTPEAQKAMLQALLADRFKLAIHKDTKPMPAFALTAGKRPTLKPADGSGETGCKFTPPPRPEAGSPVPMAPTFSYSCHNMTMAAFTEGMRDMVAAFQYLNGSPVADQTKLEGSWDFDFKYSLRGRIMPGGAAADTITLFDAIDKQLGLKLDPARIPMPVIVVDSVNRTPSGNAPGVTESLHAVPVPTEFDVAVVKPTDADFRGMRFDMQPGGRVNLQGMTLKFLIEQAWNINDDMLVGAPKWMDTDRFDIVAKATAAVAAGDPRSGPQIDEDAVWAMMRALLADRFKLATHREDRPVSAYTLLAIKPKLKKADPASRTRFKEGPATPDDDKPPEKTKDPRAANPALSRLVTCQNMTMAQFAEKLQSIAPGYIHSPVLDATGLNGAWDFTLSFSPAGMFRGGGGRGGDAVQPPGAGAEASDPGGGLTLLEAVEKELGLKLEMQKRPISVLVIDHVEQKPDN